MNKKESRKKRLTIYNTDRYYNVNLLVRGDLEAKIVVSELNKKAIQTEMDELKKASDLLPAKNTKEYIIYQDLNNDDKLVKDVITHSKSVSYYTNTIAPFHVIKDLASNVGSEVIFGSRPKFSYDDVDNVSLTFMACPVVIDIPVIIPDISPYDVLFMLHPLKTNVDKVQLSFPRLNAEEITPRHKEYYHRVGKFYEVKPEYKYKYFKYVQTSLSIWAMNIYIICDSPDDLKEVNAIIELDLDKRNPGRNRGSSHV